MYRNICKYFAIPLTFCLLLVLVVMNLTGCQQIREGKIVSMEHKDAWARHTWRTETEWHKELTGWDENGDPEYRHYTTSKQVRCYEVHPAYWKICIESDDNNEGKLQTATWYISETEYSKASIGIWYKVTEDATTEDGIHIQDDTIWMPSLEGYKIIE